MNLLSVSQLTRHNDCAISFTSTGTYFTPDPLTMPPEASARFQLINGIYHLPLLTATTPPPTCHSRQQTNQPITAYFKSAKPSTAAQTRATLPDPTPTTPTPPATPKTTVPPIRTTTPAPSVTLTTSTASHNRLSLPSFRGHYTDPKTHLIPYPHHLPPIPTKLSPTAYMLYTWHLRLNHTPPSIIRSMAAHPAKLELPSRLSHAHVPVHCHGCATGHMQRASHPPAIAVPLVV